MDIKDARFGGKKKICIFMLFFSSVLYSLFSVFVLHKPFEWSNGLMLLLCGFTSNLTQS